MSLATVALLGVVGFVIWQKGRQFDPARFALRTEALRSTLAVVEGKAGTLHAQAQPRPEAAASRDTSEARPSAEGESAMESGEGASGVTGAAASRTAAVKSEPLELQVAGLRPMSETEFYGPNNLFEKIDGRAPAYLGFNFLRLRCRSFTLPGASGSYIDVFEYSFDTPINAFGLFALERDAKGKALEFAPDGYASGMGFFFRQGPCYVQVLASDQEAKTLALARTVAEDRARALPADNTGLDARRRLPATGLDPASVAFIQNDARGQVFLKNVFQATYDFGGKKLPFFLMVTTPAEAAAAWKSYLDFSGKFGGKVTALPDIAGAKIFRAESFGSWKVVYQREGELGGVYDTDDAERAGQFVEQYLQGKIL